MAQIIMPQRRQKDDPLDTLIKGLSIASQVYGIKTNMAQLDDFEKKNKLADEDRARAESERKRLEAGQYNKNERIELSKHYDISDKPSEGAIQISSTEAPNTPLYLSVREQKQSRLIKTIEGMKGGVAGTIVKDYASGGKELDFIPKAKQPGSGTGKKKLQLIDTVDEAGNPIQIWVSPEEGKSYSKTPTSKDEGTSTQFSAANYGRRVQSANLVFDELEDEGYNRAAKAEGLKGKILPNFMQGDFRKRQEQAERNFVTAVLRRESGAAISESEFASAEKQYFPRVGDSPETLAQKRQNRLQALAGLKAEAGRTWEKVPLVAVEKTKKEREEGTAYAAPHGPEEPPTYGPNLPPKDPYTMSVEELQQELTRLRGGK